MIDRLAELEARYDEVSRLMASPEMASDHAAIADLGRELARLEPIVQASREWRSLREELERTRAMADDPDEEMRDHGSRGDRAPDRTRGGAHRASCVSSSSRVIRTTTGT